jgi:hypothetical protein
VALVLNASARVRNTLASALLEQLDVLMLNAEKVGADLQYV